MAFIQRTDTKKGKRYKVHYSDSKTGKRRSKTFPTRKQAKFFLEDIPKSTYLHPRDSVTIEKAADRWLEVCKETGRKGREPVENSTLKKYKLHVKYINALIGGEKLSDLNPARCKKFREELLQIYTRSYARKILISFKGILSQARDEEWLYTNPAENVIITLSTRDRPQHTDMAPSLVDIRNILQQADKNAKHTHQQSRQAWARYRPFVYTLVFSGCRPGELMGLPWESVLFVEGGLNIFQDLDEDGQIGRPKSKAGYRFIPMPDHAMKLLKEWKLACPTGDLDLVFPNGLGKPDSLQNVTRRAWHPLQMAANTIKRHPEKTDKDGHSLLVPKYTLKDMRHVRASMEIEGGANPKEIKSLMGHSSIKVTYDVYGHLFQDHEDRRAARANQIAASLITGC